MFDFFNVGDAAVDGDDQAHTLIVQFLEGGIAQSMALGDAVGNIGNHAPPSAASPCTIRAPCW